MTDREIIKGLLKIKKMTQSQLASLAGFRSQSNITGMLNSTKDGMKVMNFAKLLDALECDIVVRDRATDREWVVDMKDTF